MRRLGACAAVLAAIALAPMVRTQDRLSPTGFVVVIDPGHGGDDVGVRGGSGLEEKQLTLEVTQRLRAMLESRLVARVAVTRDADLAVSADDRAGMANSARGQLFLSLHANAAPSSARSGAEIYYGAPEITAPTVATLDPLFVPWDQTAGRHFDLSARAAGLMSDEIERQMSMTTRTAHAPLRAVAGVNMPAVVVEMLFLTNPDQEKAAATPEFRDRMVAALAEAVSRFRTTVEAMR